MVQSNKILTVSYGTFSCTLEGFDDSFGTMKAIAEYFRDLASDDRYFGAEPPVPDAEMMTRIAQHEISRKVEAHNEDGRGIVLRVRDLDPVAPSGSEGAVHQRADEPAATIEIQDQSRPASPEPVFEIQHPELVDDAQVPNETGAMPELSSGSPSSSDRPESACDSIESPEIEDFAADMAASLVDAKDDTQPSRMDTPDETVACDAPDTRANDGLVSDGSDFGADVTSAELQGRTETEVTEIGPSNPEISDSDQVCIPADDPIAAATTQSDMPLATNDGAPEPHVCVADRFERDSNEVETTDESWEDSSYPFDTPEIERTPPPVQVDAPPTETRFNVSGLGDTIAAKLQRIRAVVSRHEVAAQGNNASRELTEDEPADAYVTKVADEMTEALNADADNLLGSVLNRLEVKDVPEKSLRTDAVDTKALQGPVSGDPIPEKEVRLDADAEWVDLPDETADFDERLGDANLAEKDSFQASLKALEGHTDSDNTGRSWPDPDLALEPETEMMLSILDSASESSAETPPSETDHICPIHDDMNSAKSEMIETASRTQGLQLEQLPLKNGPRVLKVKRSELENALAAGELEELGQDTPRPKFHCNIEQTARESVSSSTSEDVNPSEKPDSAEPLLHRPIETEPQPLPMNEQELQRLMGTTDQKMTDDETTVAHASYGHARAVASTVLKGNPQQQRPIDDVDDSAFREDLERIIRPRRPVAREIGPDRPSTEPRPGPLKLVAEQRIDCDIQGGPVRPRRIPAEAMEDVSNQHTCNESFVEFATGMGATGLPELLEAAAAYMSFVEGRAQFSRPQLMTKVRQISSTSFNREDGLRSFGLLLRQGKIQKTGGGRFAASSEIGFRRDGDGAVENTGDDGRPRFQSSRRA